MGQSPLDHEAINSVRGLANDAMHPKVVKFSEHGGPRKAVVITPQGREEFDLTNHRGHHVENIDDLCDLTKRIATGASIWHDEGMIRVCFDDDDRFDLATMALQKDSRFEAVVTLRQSQMSHPEFVRFLRIRLDSAIPGAIVNIFEAVKFNKDSESEARIQRQSISRRAMAAAAGVGEIPNEITVSTPVYSEAQVPEQPTAKIRCLIEIDPSQEKFFITPIERDIELAKMDAARHIHERLTAKTEKAENVLGIYQGRP